MKKLFYLYNNITNKFSWLICNEKKEIVDKGETNSMTHLDTKDVDKVFGLHLSIELFSKMIEVPPASENQITKSIPFLLEDKLLRPLEDYHFITSKRNEKGYVQVSIAPKSFMNDVDDSIRDSEHPVVGLSSVDSAIDIEDGQCVLSIFDDVSFIVFGSRWHWCADTQTILSFLEKGMQEYECQQLRVFTNRKNKEVDLSSYTNVKPIIETFASDTDFLTKIIKLISPKVNLLSGKYAPRIQIKKLLNLWRYPILTFSLVLFLYFSQLGFTIMQNYVTSNRMLDESSRLYFETFPEEPKNIDLSTLLNKKLRSVSSFSAEPFLQTLANVSKVVADNERTSLFSISYDISKAQFIMEVQCQQYDDLEAIQERFSSGGYQVEVGVSKKVGESVLSEIYLSKS